MPPSRFNHLWLNSRDSIEVTLTSGYSVPSAFSAPRGLQPEKTEQPMAASLIDEELQRLADEVLPELARLRQRYGLPLVAERGVEKEDDTLDVALRVLSRRRNSGA